MIKLGDDLQKVFDKVSRHLNTQGHRAGEPIPCMDAVFQCSYLMPNGDRCAVGCLIRRSKYKPEIETRNSDSLFISGFFSGSENMQLMLAELQGIHDNPEWSEIKASLRELGQRFNLNTEALDTLSFVPH